MSSDAHDETSSSDEQEDTSDDSGAEGDTSEYSHSDTSVPISRKTRKRRPKKAVQYFDGVRESDYSPPPKRKKHEQRKTANNEHRPLKSEPKKCSVTKCLIKKSVPLLKLLCRATDDERKCMLQHVDDSAIDIVCCCVFNAIWNKKLVSRDRMRAIRKRLSPSQDALLYLAKHSNSTRTRRKLLVQQGGSLPLLLSAVLPAITAAKEKIKREKKDQTSGEQKINNEHVRHHGSNALA
jgi:hypothetical protein